MSSLDLQFSALPRQTPVVVRSATHEKVVGEVVPEMHVRHSGPLIGGRADTCCAFGIPLGALEDKDPQRVKVGSMTTRCQVRNRDDHV